MAHIAARKVMRFQRIAADIQTSFPSRDAIVHNQTDWNPSQTHPDHLSNADWCVRNAGPQPRHEVFGDNNYKHKRDERKRRNDDKIKRFHIGAKTIGTEAARKRLIADGSDAALRRPDSAARRPYHENRARGGT